MRRRKKRNFIHELLHWIFILIILFTVIFLSIRFVGEQMTATEEAMYPAISSGDHVIVDKVSYRFTNPSRYDIIVVPFKYEEDTYCMRRVIGLPGETIQIYNGDILINGKVLDDPYMTEKIENPGIAFERITLEEDEYFTLGDNRNSSTDSREPSFGYVEQDDIVGRVLFRIWPLERIGLIN